MGSIVFTIGHSNHHISNFLDLLRKFEISAVADVRSKPSSRFVPHYNQKNILTSLKEQGIAYAYLGIELGGRSDNPDYYINGRVQYSMLAGDPRFEEGILRIKRGMEKYRIALMCSEKDPIDCHRGLLISPHLVQFGIQVVHILANGNSESQEEFENRLLARYSLENKDMFRERNDVIAKAYELQENRVASSAMARPGKINEDGLL